MPVTNNDARKRQQAFRAKMQLAGFVQVTAWVHESQLPDVQDYLRQLREKPHLTTGPLKDPVTGKLVSTKV